MVKIMIRKKKTDEKENISLHLTAHKNQTELLGFYFMLKVIRTFSSSQLLLFVQH